MPLIKGSNKGNSNQTIEGYLYIYVVKLSVNIICMEPVVNDTDHNIVKPIELVFGWKEHGDTSIELTPTFEQLQTGM